MFLTCFEHRKTWFLHVVYPWFLGPTILRTPGERWVGRCRALMGQAWRDYASVQIRMHNICKEVLAPRYADCTLAELTHVNPFCGESCWFETLIFAVLWMWILPGKDVQSARFNGSIPLGLCSKNHPSPGHDHVIAMIITSPSAAAAAGTIHIHSS